MVVGTLAGLAHTAEQGFEYCEGYGVATQHAQVALDRITRAIYGATANEQFPGCIVVAETVNSWTLSGYAGCLESRWPTNARRKASQRDCGKSQRTAAILRIGDLLSASDLSQSIGRNHSSPGDTRTLPAVTDTVRHWLSQIAAIKTNSQSKIVTLTSLLRSCPIASATGSALRGAVRFETRLKTVARRLEQLQE